MGSKSLVKETPVLLISGKVFSETTLLNAYFEKDGCYFRITHRGPDLSEEEFIKILESML